MSVELEREIVFLDDILKEDRVRERVFKIHNWADVKDFANIIFFNFAFEINWAEDAWNILMFDSVVNSQNIERTNYNSYEKGDVILWLAALYDIYYEYKVAADYEYEDTSILMQVITNIEDSEKYISEFLKKDIFSELNTQLLESTCKSKAFYDVEADTFIFDDEYLESSIAYEVYYREVKRRGDIIRDIFYSYFKKDEMALCEFFGGIHWCENYLDIEKKRHEIIKKYEKILENIEQGKIVKYTIGSHEYDYTDGAQVEEEMNEELENLEDEIDEYTSDYEKPDVHTWISNGMSL